MNEQGERKEGAQNGSSVPELSAFRETAETITRLGFVLVVGCYIAGLIILNLHLGQYGVTELGFLQIKYVMVGALWAVLVGSTYFAFYYTVWNVKARYREWQEGGRRVGRGVLLVLLVITAPASVTYGLPFLSDNELIVWPTKNLLQTLSVLGLLGVSAVTVEVLIQDVRGALSRLPSAEVSRNADSVANRAAAYMPFYRILGLITLLGAYATWAFPKFLPALGGGKLQKVESLAKGDQINSFLSLGLNVSPKDRKVGPLELIFESTDSLTVEPPKIANPDGRIKVIRIKKDLIDAVIYLTKK